jgi:hypothetical protein
MINCDTQDGESSLKMVFITGIVSQSAGNNKGDVWGHYAAFIL